VKVAVARLRGCAVAQRVLPRNRATAQPRNLLAALLVLLSLTSRCREAGGAAQDPLEKEAEEAFVAYLRIDTSNPPGNETNGAAFLRDLFVKDGIAAQLVGDDPKRQGVYARLVSDSKEPALLLLSHIDVVPADPSVWTQPPFSGARKGGYIWGRGALDTKSLTIAELMSMLELKRRSASLRRDIVFLATPDEELAGLNGTKKLLDQNPQLFENVGFVLNEGGTNETAVDKVLFWGIEVQQKVPLWVRITAEGTGGHGAIPPDDGGATAKLVRALDAVRAIETPYRLEASVARAAAAGAAVRTDARRERLRLFREPLDVERIQRDVPAGSRSLLHDTIAITHIAAGSSVNMIPSRATGDVDIRLLPDTKPDAMLARVREAVGKNGTIEVLAAGEPVAESSAKTELFEVVAHAMRAHAAGSAVAPVVGPGTTDSRYFRAKGITAYGIMPFKVNYYDADSVHGVDERIRTRFFSEGVRLTRNIVRDFCEVK
jgi:acetylornithine deacetylase/succinyl-diaminopimelate desuccinylase-like protein